LLRSLGESDALAVPAVTEAQGHHAADECPDVIGGQASDERPAVIELQSEEHEKVDATPEDELSAPGRPDADRRSDPHVAAPALDRESRVEVVLDADEEVPERRDSLTARDKALPDGAKKTLQL
jgi:hypothetical protein